MSVAEARSHSQAWRQQYWRRAAQRRADTWLADRRAELNDPNAPLLTRIGRWFNRAWSEEGWDDEVLRMQARDMARPPRAPAQPELVDPNQAWYYKYPWLAKGLMGAGLGTFYGGPTYGATQASPGINEVFTGSTRHKQDATPEPINSQPIGSAITNMAKRPRSEDSKDDIDMTQASAATAGGSSVPVNMSSGGHRAHTSGYTGKGMVGLVGSSHRSTPGSRNHALLAKVDEHKLRGRKRARDGITRLFEAAEEWIPFHAQCINSQFTKAQPALDTSDAWQGGLIARSRSTFASILSINSLYSPNNTWSTTGNDYLRNGMFASVPAGTTVQGVTPGLRLTELPHIGKLIINGSLSPVWYSAAPANYSNQWMKTTEFQLHLIRFAQKWTFANINNEASVAINAGKITAILDAADFDLGIGSESYINGSIVQGQVGILPAGTNVMVAQEQDNYPPRDHYKIHWSSPIMTLTRAQEGNQIDASASATSDETKFNEPRIDITNIVIPIDDTISMNSGNSSSLNTLATNRDDKFDCFHLVVTYKPSSIDPNLFFGRQGDNTLKEYNNALDGFIPSLVGNITYIYNFKENR